MSAIAAERARFLDLFVLPRIIALAVPEFLYTVEVGTAEYPEQPA